MGCVGAANEVIIDSSDIVKLVGGDDVSPIFGGAVDIPRIGVIPVCISPLGVFAFGATRFGVFPFGVVPFHIDPIDTVPFETTTLDATPLGATSFCATAFDATPFGATAFVAIPLDATFFGVSFISLMLGFPFTLSFEFVDPLEFRWQSEAVNSEVEAGKKRPTLRGDTGIGGRAPRKDDDDDDDKSDDDEEDNDENDEVGGSVRYRGVAEFPPE